jgi:hypothetical protein
MIHVHVCDIISSDCKCWTLYALGTIFRNRLIPSQCSYYEATTHTFDLRYEVFFGCKDYFLVEYQAHLSKIGFNTCCSLASFTHKTWVVAVLLSKLFRCQTVTRLIFPGMVRASSRMKALHRLLFLHLLHCLGFLWISLASYTQTRILLTSLVVRQ